MMSRAEVAQLLAIHAAGSRYTKDASSDVQLVLWQEAIKLRAPAMTVHDGRRLLVKHFASSQEPLGVSGLCDLWLAEVAPVVKSARRYGVVAKSHPLHEPLTDGQRVELERRRGMMQPLPPPEPTAPRSGYNVQSFTKNIGRMPSS